MERAIKTMTPEREAELNRRVDVSLLLAALKRTPSERLLYATIGANNVRRMVESARLQK